ncbi:MAG: hypothetical protein KGJ02_04770 [Verrucomicrobiota bacterium]|nr:hypothetical protein [Verrucomicrobiota bacterium]
MKWFFLLLPAFLHPVAIVLIHLGSHLPAHLPLCVEQARLFNPEVPIYLVANEQALSSLSSDLPVIAVAAETLPKSSSHQFFIRHNHLDKHFLKGFWVYTTERFFYLDSLMKKYSLTDVFHLENDVMLYVDLTHTLPLFRKNYPDQIAATFDNDVRCIAGFMYIPHREPLKSLTHFIGSRARHGGNDMELIASFKNNNASAIDHLPILMPAYAENRALESTSRQYRTNTPSRYFHCFEDFRSIFDAAAIGQYLGGIDPYHGSNTIGFINESALFNASDFTYEWIPDEHGRSIPYALYQGERYKINNLHIHSKNLSLFLSQPQGLP